MFDEFVIAHVLGWWGKAVMIRNQLLLWVLSVGFELMEVRKAALTSEILFPFILAYVHLVNFHELL